MGSWRLTTDDVLDIVAYLAILIGLRNNYGQAHPFHGPMPLTFYLPWLAVFGGFALAWYVGLRARGRREQLFRQDSYYCLNCGYDMIATPYRCPECGQPHRRSVRARDAQVPDPRWVFSLVATLAVVTTLVVAR